MYDQSDAYHYRNYAPTLAGAAIIPSPSPAFYRPHKPSPYLVPQAMAESFREGLKSIDKAPDLDDLFHQKVEIAGDKIDLILGEIQARDRLRYDNLARLYDDLLRVSSWRQEISFPENYQRGRTWSDLNKAELQLHEQIRRELKDAAKDTAFPSKDLREGLLEFKIQERKSRMMDSFEEVPEQ